MLLHDFLQRAASRTSGERNMLETIHVCVYFESKDHVMIYGHTPRITHASRCIFRVHQKW